MQIVLKPNPSNHAHDRNESLNRLFSSYLRVRESFNVHYPVYRLLCVQFVFRDILSIVLFAKPPFNELPWNVEKIIQFVCKLTVYRELYAAEKHETSQKLKLYEGKIVSPNQTM